MPCGSCDSCRRHLRGPCRQRLAPRAAAAARRTGVGQPGARASWGRSPPQSLARAPAAGNGSVSSAAPRCPPRRQVRRSRRTRGTSRCACTSHGSIQTCRTPCEWSQLLEQTSRHPTARREEVHPQSGKCPVGASASVWWLQNVWKPSGGRPSPQGGGTYRYIGQRVPQVWRQRPTVQKLICVGRVVRSAPGSYHAPGVFFPRVLPVTWSCVLVRSGLHEHEESPN